MEHRDRLRGELTKRKAGLTGHAFAATLGVSRTYWWRIETGDRQMPDAIIRRAAEAYPDLRELCVAALLEPRERRAA